MEKPFISICIPSYNSDNRPGNLGNLLKTIDIADAEAAEIIVCDDKSPRQEKVRKEIESFKRSTKYKVRYYENPINLGYDGNIKELAGRAEGEWIVFMGDDDEFVPGALDKLAKFLREHNDLGYILKSHITVRVGGEEKFRYYAKTHFFPPGPDTLIQLFRKSVFISGFTIRREFLPPPVDDFNHSLLYQHYLLGEVVLKYPSAYFDEPITLQYDDAVEMPGETRELSTHVARTPSMQTSINFLRSFISIPEFFDKKYNLRISTAIKKDMSKYFYPSLSIHRDKGLKIFLGYVKEVNNLGFNITVYYYLYIFLLIIFGKRFCDNGIKLIKKILGRTPKL